jgi:hypothetical protein
MTFRAAVILPLMSSISSKCLPFNIFFTFGREKSHWGIGPVNREVVPAQLGSIKCWEVLELLHNWQAHQKGSAP